MIDRALRFLRTVSYLQPVQVYGRVWFRLSRPRPDVAPTPSLRPLLRTWSAPACREPSLTGPGAFRFLNETGTLAANGWDDSRKAKLWRYNQHYFDDLNAERAENRSAWHTELIANWVEANPPGQGTAWEPYPTSLRIVNWIKWSLAGNTLSDAALHSLTIQIRWLAQRIEWHLLGNHLFANAKSLVYAGLFFDGPEANIWLYKGLKILQQQIPEQILPDGGQFELSPMYHALACEDMLDLVNITRTFGKDDFAHSWSKIVPHMLHWLMVMTHPDGKIAFFNDTAFGIAPTNDQILCYAVRLGFDLPLHLPNFVNLPNSGYARSQRGSAILIMDTASIGPDYLPGHAHADTLSFELSVNRQRIIVNSGTSVYSSGPERLRQRGTSAHSTIVIDGLNSSEVWSGFRVGRRARPFDIEFCNEVEALKASAAHDGYRYLTGAPIHRRTWHHQNGRLVVNDAIEGSGYHEAQLLFHLAPHLKIIPISDNEVNLCDEIGDVNIIIFVNSGIVQILPSSWHPEFGLTISSNVLSIGLKSALPLLVETTIRWS